MTQHSTPDDHKLMILYTTIASLKEAEYLAKKAVEAKLAACINIIPGTQSIYLSEKTIKSSVECCMFFKTSASYLPLLEQWILANHPYDTPSILKWEANSTQAYHQYVTSNLTESHN